MWTGNTLFSSLLLKQQTFVTGKDFEVSEYIKTTIMDLSANYAESHIHHVEISQADKAVTLLKWTFGLVPIVAGADKFLHILTDWDKYLAPQIAHALPFSAHSFMMIVGIIEIIAGILVLVKPRIGSLIVGLWLVGIAINLLLTGQYYDVAVRDAVMAIAAFSLCILTSRHK
jgi:uncharacterized membrane protein YphA (DoxX/SURF4 family)